MGLGCNERMRCSLIPGEDIGRSYFFQCVVPVLSAFFAYLDEQHLQKNAASMAREIKTCINAL